jgi:hypothetical protein
MKKSRTAPFACLLLGSFLTAGCTLYKNPNTCEAQMRAAAAQALPHDKLSITHVGVGIGGSRVVVEGTLQSPPVAASTASAASASAVQASSSAVAASATHASSPAAHWSSSAATSKPPPRTAAVECAFNGEALATWHWLNPPDLAKPADPAKPDVTQH